MEDRLSRRVLLGAAGGIVLAACGRSAVRRQAAPTTRPSGSPPTSPSTSPTASAAASPATAAPRRAQVVRTGTSGRPEVALTFHGSGDTALAEQLLGEAEKAHAAVTVFAVGTWLAANPQMAQRILRGGHALGNHTYTHPTLHRLPAPQIDREVSRCADLLQRLTGSVGAAFRPSGGPTINAPIVTAATLAGYRTVVGYDVDPSDNHDPGAAAVASRVLRDVRAGSIVSLHLGHRGTVDALPKILDGLASRGLRPVTVPRLLAPA